MIERADRFSEDTSAWVHELGITLSLAPVVVRFYSPTLPSDEDTWRQIQTPHGINFCWLTTQLSGVEHLGKDYRLTAVIDRDGEASDVGFAVPTQLTDQEPFLFQWQRRDGDLSIIRFGTQVIRLGQYRDSLVYKIGHQYISRLIPQEWYFLFHVRGPSSSALLPELAPKKFLVSGVRHRSLWHRLKTDRLAPHLPFTPLLGKWKTP